MLFHVCAPEAVTIFVPPYTLIDVSWVPVLPDAFVTSTHEPFVVSVSCAPHSVPSCSAAAATNTSCRAADGVIAPVGCAVLETLFARVDVTARGVVGSMPAHSSSTIAEMGVPVVHVNVTVSAAWNGVTTLT